MLMIMCHEIGEQKCNSKETSAYTLTCVMTNVCFVSSKADPNHSDRSSRQSMTPHGFPESWECLAFLFFVRTLPLVAWF